MKSVFIVEINNPEGPMQRFSLLSPVAYRKLKHARRAVRIIMVGAITGTTAPAELTKCQSTDDGWKELYSFQEPGKEYRTTVCIRELKVKRIKREKGKIKT